VVKSFASSRQESAKFAKTNDEYMKLSMKSARILVVIMPLFSLILNFGIVAVIWIGGIQVEAGGLQTGQIMAFVNYLTRMLMSIMMIGMMLIFVSRAQASARRISEVLETPEEEDVKTTEKFDLNGPIVFQNVNFSYEGNERKVLRDINLTINPGETVAFLGDTGSGKSTLVNLIPRLYEVTSGRIMLNGIDITKIPRRELRKEIAFVFQETILFSGKISDNIAYGNPNASLEDIQQAADMARVGDFISTLPEGYDTNLSQMATNLSGGQRQRVAIARALASGARIIVFDDSTSALDAQTEVAVMKAINDRLKCTKIIIAQKISSVVNCDRIYLLETGRIVASGTHGELMKTSDLYREIYRSQFGEVGEESA
jgi:ATP-binding cassette subfamily B protein